MIGCGAVVTSDRYPHNVHSAIGDDRVNESDPNPLHTDRLRAIGMPEKLLAAGEQERYAYPEKSSQDEKVITGLYPER
ncbi:hypothetical protein [Argonema galeatum]|uniref:hypothetical protein n=1 Tax=Argonema galeatum TaxID=2942762 RepID=UPI00201363D5|nr:hypothetical protein [Argonema galeatum]MCL1465775.1 hypothetical protein [Argonema galeatum A003/A1]